MKKFLVLLMMFLMITSSCLAMTFSQPVELGGASVPPDTGFNIRGSSQNNGNVYKTVNGTISALQDFIKAKWLKNSGFKFELY